MELGVIRSPDSETQQVYVKRRVVDDEGRPVGVPHDNPIIDLRQYEVEFLDGETQVVMAKLIAENILSHVDDYGHMHIMLDEIRILPDAIPKDKGIYTTKQGNTRKQCTTKGWDLLVKWKDGSSNWV